MMDPEIARIFAEHREATRRHERESEIVYWLAWLLLVLLALAVRP